MAAGNFLHLKAAQAWAEINSGDVEFMSCFTLKGTASKARGRACRSREKMNEEECLFKCFRLEVLRVKTVWILSQSTPGPKTFPWSSSLLVLRFCWGGSTAVLSVCVQETVINQTNKRLPSPSSCHAIYFMLNKKCLNQFSTWVCADRSCGVLLCENK